MKRPMLNKIDTFDIIKHKGLVVTMSKGQWDKLLECAYDDGAVLMELDKNEMPVAHYQRKASNQ